ncbi:hypothetical protein ACU635_44395 [[Actinomadura] parvosata]|uniref:hypothetical protein n=1 Tax=[Actinomadura] parvosata TaxID=1955412 RepID=UPI00406CE7EC
MTATSCAQPTARTTAPEPAAEPSVGPTSTLPGLVVTEEASGPDVCALISAEQMGAIYGTSAVTATNAAVAGHGSQLGACDYAISGFTLTVAAHLRDPAMGPAETAEAYTYGKGTPIAGLGEAAAVATYDGSDPKLAELAGTGRLVAIEDEVVTLITGPREAAERFEKVARELWPRVPSLY